MELRENCDQHVMLSIFVMTLSKAHFIWVRPFPVIGGVLIGAKSREKLLPDSKSAQISFFFFSFFLHFTFYYLLFQSHVENPEKKDTLFYM